MMITSLIHEFTPTLLTPIHDPFPICNNLYQIGNSESVGCSGCENCSGDGDGCGPSRVVKLAMANESSCSGCGHCSDGTCAEGPASCESCK